MKRSVLVLLLFVVAAIPAWPAITFKGTIKNFEGKTPPMSYVRIMNGDDETKYFDCGPNGQFEFSVPDTLNIALSFGAIDCEPRDEKIIIPTGIKLIEMEVKLKALAMSEENTVFYLIGDFNSFDLYKPTILFTSDGKGHYSAKIDQDKDTLLYQILRKDTVRGLMRSFNGQQCNFYIYDGGGDYRSGLIKEKGGQFSISFDANKYAAFTEPTKVEYKDIVVKQTQKTTRYADYFYRYYLYVRSGLMNSKLPKDSVNFLYRKAKSDYMDSLNALLNEQTDKLLRPYIILNYMKVATDGQSYLTVADKLDSNLIKELFASLPPESPMWDMNQFAGQSVYAAMALDEFPKSKYLAALLKAKHPAGTHSDIYSTIITQLEFIKDHKTAGKYFKEFRKRYPEDYGVNYLFEEYFMVKKLKVGAGIPKFSTINIDDSTKIIDNKALKGKYVLIDFWSIGCGPCIGEMGNLDSAYKTFKDRNFTILSVSIDYSPLPVQNFRSKKWKMPWLNAVVGGWKDKITKSFEVTGVPRPILIDPNGKILALESDLRGERLFKTLEKFLKN